MAENPQQLTEEQKKKLEEKIKNMSPEELMEFQKQQCIFCQIIAGKVPSKKIYEDNKVIVILDINPAIKGHVLVLPKEHYAIMPQIPEKELGQLFVVAKTFSKKMLKGLKVAGTNIFIANGLSAGQRSQHFMIHVIPRREGDHIFRWEENLIDKNMIQKVKIAIQNQLNKGLGVNKEFVAVDDVENNEEDEVEEKPKPKNKVNTKKKKKPAMEKEEVEETASLDDIADLFK